MKHLLYGITMGIAMGIIIMQAISFARIEKLERQDVLYEIRIVSDFINVRNQPTTNGKKLYEINKGETYSVIDIFEDDSMYMWYKIIFSDRRTGWLASSHQSPWVEKIEKEK